MEFQSRGDLMTCPMLLCLKPLSMYNTGRPAILRSTKPSAEADGTGASPRLPFVNGWQQPTWYQHHWPKTIVGQGGPKAQVY